MQENAAFCECILDGCKDLLNQYRVDFVEMSGIHPRGEIISNFRHNTSDPYRLAKITRIRLESRGTGFDPLLFCVVLPGYHDRNLNYEDNLLFLFLNIH